MRETQPRDDYLNDIADRLRADWEAQLIDRNLFLEATSKNELIERYSKYKILLEIGAETDIQQLYNFAKCKYSLSEFVKAVDKFTPHKKKRKQLTSLIKKSYYYAAVWPEGIYSTQYGSFEDEVLED